MREKYCVVCGRKLGKDEPLIDGMCPTCFFDRKGLFRERPVLTIIICPRCGSWLYKGEWRDPLPMREVIRRIALRELEKNLRDKITIVDIDITSDLYKVNKTQYGVKARVSVILADYYPVTREIELVLNINRMTCPRCLAVAGGAHKALVQIRSVRGHLDENDMKIIGRALRDPGVAAEIVEIKEKKTGLDVKLLSQVAAKRLSMLLSRDAGAKVVESFKPAKYNPDKGAWDGITTLSVRLPDLNKGDLVEYRGRPGVVKSRDMHGVKISMLDDGSNIRVPYDDYWKGRLKKPGYMVYDKEFLVVAGDESTLYLLNEETGELDEFPRTKGLKNVKTGDRLKRVRVRDKVYMVKE